MKLTSLLDERLVHLQLTPSSLDECLVHLSGELAQHPSCRTIGKETILNAIREREKLGGTILDFGLAIPHARLDGLNDFLIAFCNLAQPLQAGSVSVRAIIMFLTSKTSSNRYLQTLASLVRFFQEPGKFDAYCQKKSAGDLLELFKDVMVKKELSVEDIMTRDVMTVAPATSLKDLADFFYTHNISYAPVVDAEGRLIGEATITELLKAGLPNYAMMVGNLDFLTSLEPFEDLLKNENTDTVAKVMRKPALTFSRRTSVMEAALDFTQNKRRHVPVVEDGKLVGIVSTTDILNKVIRG